MGTGGRGLFGRDLPFYCLYVGYLGGMMAKYQVVICTHAVYEVDAENEQDAEALAWDLYDYGDLSDAHCAEILKLEEE